MAKAKEEVVAKIKKEPVKKEPRTRALVNVHDRQERVSLWTRLNVRLSEKEKVLFVKYLSVLLDADLSLLQAIEVLRDQATGSTRKILETVSKSIAGGEGLADGLERYSHIFSHIFINLIRAGEDSGTLSENLQYLAIQSQKQYDLKQSIKGAMMYPFIVFFGGMGVSIFIIIFIFPNIISLFETMHVELPFTTRALLIAANFFKNYPAQVFGGGAAFFAALFFSYQVSLTRRLWDRVLLYVPVLGAIIRNSILASFFRLLGTLLQSGMPLTDALNIANSTITNHAYNKMLNEIKQHVTQGRDLAEELSTYKFLIPGLAQRLIHVGDATGTLEKMLLFLADFYAKEVDESSKRIAVLVEPLLIIVMGIMIAFVALAVISPIYGVITAI